MTITHPLPLDTKVRVVRKPSGDFGSASPIGTEFVIDGYNPADGDDVAFYDGSNDWGSVEADADAVEVVMSAEQMTSRELPGIDTIREYVSDLSGDVDGIDVTTSTPLDEGTVELRGVTADGLRFVATVQVVSVIEDMP